LIKLGATNPARRPGLIKLGATNPARRPGLMELGATNPARRPGLIKLDATNPAQRPGLTDKGTEIIERCYKSAKMPLDCKKSELIRNFL
jgi:hypothetical protein